MTASFEAIQMCDGVEVTYAALASRVSSRFRAGVSESGESSIAEGFAIMASEDAAKSLFGQIQRAAELCAEKPHLVEEPGWQQVSQRVDVSSSTDQALGVANELVHATEFGPSWGRRTVVLRHGTYLVAVGGSDYMGHPITDPEEQNMQHLVAAAERFLKAIDPPASSELATRTVTVSPFGATCVVPADGETTTSDGFMAVTGAGDLVVRCWVEPLSRSVDEAFDFRRKVLTESGREVLREVRRPTEYRLETANAHWAWTGRYLVVEGQFLATEWQYAANDAEADAAAKAAVGALAVAP